MTDKIVILSSCDTPEKADEIARKVVELRLAACAQILPGMRSVYRWKGAVEQSDEILLVIKSRRELFDQIRHEIEKLHPYEVPEIVALPIVDGLQSYLDWIDVQTT